MLNRPVRVALYGAGSFAKQRHLPNLNKIAGVEVVALCDSNEATARSAAVTFNVPRIYTDADELLANESIDALYSVVPAYVRTDVESKAVLRGIHLFSEKPQALRMGLVREIDAAIQRAGVFSTVSFRERYRPFFQEARRLLAGKAIVHVRFQISESPRLSGDRYKSWWEDFEKSGAIGLDWGIHAVDCTRFMTGLNIERAQSFYCRREHTPQVPLSWMFNFALSNGGTMTLSTLSVTAGVRPEETQPWFTIYYEGGQMALYGYERIEVDGETVYRSQDFDPWLEHSRRFIEAVRTGDNSNLLNDYHDGLYSLGPVLAGWHSARNSGVCIDVEAFVRQG